MSLTAIWSCQCPFVCCLFHTQSWRSPGAGRGWIGTSHRQRRILVHRGFFPSSRQIGAGEGRLWSISDAELRLVHAHSPSAPLSFSILDYRSVVHVNSDQLDLSSHVQAHARFWLISRRRPHNPHGPLELWTPANQSWTRSDSHIEPLHVLHMLCHDGSIDTASPRYRMLPDEGHRPRQPME